MYQYQFILQRKTKPSLSLNYGNQLISANDRLHFAVKMKLTEYLRKLAQTQAQAQDHFQQAIYSPAHPCHVTVTIAPPTNRRMDPPNWYPTVKALIDGLTDAGLWTDDNRSVIESMTFICGPKTSDHCYHITIQVTDASKGG